MPKRARTRSATVRFCRTASTRNLRRRPGCRGGRSTTITPSRRSGGRRRAERLPAYPHRRCLRGQGVVRIASWQLPAARWDRPRRVARHAGERRLRRRRTCGDLRWANARLGLCRLRRQTPQPAPSGATPRVARRRNTPIFPARETGCAVRTVSSASFSSFRGERRCRPLRCPNPD